MIYLELYPIRVGDVHATQNDCALRWVYLIPKLLLQLKFT